MKNTVKIVAGILGLGLGLVWAMEEHQMPKRTYSMEFEQVKNLAGSWKGTGFHPDGKTEPAFTEYRVTSNGSAVEERLMPGTPHEMVDMYTEENGKVAMTHYCAIGNQPHMISKQADSKKIALETTVVPGLDAAKDMHMHALTLEFPDKDHLVQTWTSHTGGKPSEVMVFKFARAPSR